MLPSRRNKSFRRFVKRSSQDFFSCLTAPLAGSNPTSHSVVSHFGLSGLCLEYQLYNWWCTLFYPSVSSSAKTIKHVPKKMVIGLYAVNGERTFFLFCFEEHQKQSHRGVLKGARVVYIFQILITLMSGEERNIKGLATWLKLPFLWRLHVSK